MMHPKGALFYLQTEPRFQKEKRLKLLAATISILIMLSTISTANENTQSQFHYKVMKLRNGDISVVITLTTNNPSKCPNASSWLWGSEMECPKVRIQTLVAKHNNELIFIPLSSYSDLGNITSARITVDVNKEFELHLKGGDAANSYIAIIKFNNENVTNRTVRSGEFPDDVWETTKYRFNELNN